MFIESRENIYYEFVKYLSGVGKNKSDLVSFNFQTIKKKKFQFDTEVPKK